MLKQHPKIRHETWLEYPVRKWLANGLYILFAIIFISGQMLQWSGWEGAIILWIILFGFIGCNHLSKKKIVDCIINFDSKTHRIVLNWDNWMDATNAGLSTAHDQALKAIVFGDDDEKESVDMGNNGDEE